MSVRPRSQLKTNAWTSRSTLRAVVVLLARCGGAEAKAYDTTHETWRHLNFFQYAAYLHARVPRVECHRCGVKKIAVPWSRSGSGFTLLFEALVMALARQMPVKAIAALCGEHDTRIWRVVHHYVEEARREMDCSQVRRVGVDETAARRGHDYISLFVDLDEKRLLFATAGKDAATVAAFAADLTAHGGAPQQIESVSCDMSPAFTKGVRAELAEAEITYDRFHLVKLMNESVDAVRREESRSVPELKGTRYLWLMNPTTLKAEQRQKLDSLPEHNLKTARAYQMRLTFQELFEQADRSAGEAFLQRWYYWATHSRLEPMIKAAKTIRAHWEGVLNWFESKMTTGFLEGLNSLVQAAKARARGYRTGRNLIAMAYLIGGKLHFNLPT
jgi:transposase